MWARTGRGAQVYRRDQVRGIRECGALDFDTPEAQLVALLDEIDPLPAEDCACVGLSHGDDDYVEISPIGNGTYFLWAEHPRPRGGLFGWLRRDDPLERTLADRDAAIAALRAWCELSRDAFEQRYA